MDIQVPFIIVPLFSLIATLVLVMVYKFGFKEKTYEDALAEQRQQTNILLGIKPKVKDKRNKKVAKKSQVQPKEKLSLDENEVFAESEQKNSELINRKKPHVEFKNDAEGEVTKSPVSKVKSTKKEKVRPILMNKEVVESEKVVNVENPGIAANNFEELHPKDDFELFKQEEAQKVHVEKVEVVDNKETDRKETTVVLSSKERPMLNGFVATTGKDKKKKKSEINSLLGHGSGPNMSVLLDLLCKAELSRSEVQILIDHLLNKQHEAPEIIDEWSEGKSDPVQKLKKQLAEKEKLLAEEQQTLASAQARLKELRSEHQMERTALFQKLRTLEEIAQSRQLEVARNAQQVQQLQNQIKDEMMQSHKLREEIAALQRQRQQFESRLNQAQETEVIIGQLQAQIQEMSTVNNQLNMQATQLSKDNMTEQERVQALMMELNNFHAECEQKTVRNEQLEDACKQLQKQENDFKIEISRLGAIVQQQNEELRRSEHNMKQCIDDFEQHKDEANKLISQLTNDFRKLQEENTQIKKTHINGSLKETEQHEIENLHSELSSLKTKLSETEKDGEQNLTAANALAEQLSKEVEDLKLQFNEQKVKNNELREKNWKVMEALNAVENRVKCKAPADQKSEEDIQKEFILRVFPEIKEEDISKTTTDTFVKQYVETLIEKDCKASNDQEVGQLNLQLEHYKKVIDNTEKMLNKLQQHIEQEEINWRVQLAAKAAELDSVKEKHREELQSKEQVIAQLQLHVSAQD